MRLIDSDALMKDICDSLNQMTNIWIAVDGDWLWAKLNDAIDNAPTIEERKKGKWIEHNPHKWGLGVKYECSECGYEVDCEEPNFCPNCGADMRGET